MIALLAGVLAFMTIVMAAAWFTVKASGDGGWTDVFWTFGTGAACIACALSPGPNISARQLVVAALAGAWALRLGLHMGLRVARSEEDARYAAFRRDWAPHFQRRMFWFLQSQAVAGAILAGALYAAAHNPEPFGRPQDYAALALVVLALGGESLADAQLRRFKADPINKGRVADHGLWGWSRHPNYFFEWLVWMAYVPLALAPGYALGWAVLAAPALMFVLLNYVSGVPPLERSMRASRGEAFAAYAARTSRFVPLPPRPSRT